MSPGPASAAVAPNIYLENNFAGLSEATLAKVLHDNAARLYKLD
jgi:predicted TIM-barrel fold metal-dependent hydrolase